jgi:hypothetical protein
MNTENAKMSFSDLQDYLNKTVISYFFFHDYIAWKYLH